MDSAAPSISIVEVGPRDGLQNHPLDFSLDTRIGFIEALADAGLRCIETTAFVNPKAVPKMADAVELMTRLDRKPNVRYMALVPNVRGLKSAMSAAVDSIALFAAATEAFSHANLNATIEETFRRFGDVMTTAKEQNMWVRGYVSVAFHCPYAGQVSPDQVLPILEGLRALDCDEFVLADTTGQATPEQVGELVERAGSIVPTDRLALHLHDTRGLAIENVATGYEGGVHIFDGSAGGIGGCPFSPGAPGNVATEVIVEYFEQRGLSTGVDASAVRAAYSTWIAPHPNPN